MPRHRFQRTRASFTGQIDEKKLIYIEELAILHNCSMARIVRALLDIALQRLDEGVVLSISHEGN